MKWITALNLEQWAATLQARTEFPAMVADLIRASATEISAIRFPSGDKGQVRGFDGELTAAGAPPYVPEGDSIWEFGVTENAANKANDDYTKRTNEVDAATRANTTFVFATPRTWNNSKKKLADWLQEKRDEKNWKAVEYFDGSKLEDWLALHPAVASRYARYALRLVPQEGAYSTEEFWDEYSNRFSPALVEEVLLAGREQQAAGLLHRLQDGTSRILFAADSPDEVIAFAIAAIRKADDVVRLYLEARTLVVNTEEAARQLSVKEGLIFLPRGQARSLVGLLAKNGQTIFSAGADEKRIAHELLVRPSSLALGKALESMGRTPKEGYDLARKCGRSLAVLARLIPNGAPENPEWLERAESLLPALLAGAWETSKPADKAALQAVSGLPDYEAVEAPLRTLTRLKDSPLEKVGDVWAMRAPVDAFVNAAHLIGQAHLDRFSAVATEIFSAIPPPPKADEVYRPSGTREEAHSKWLREGMMTTLLHMAVLHEQSNFTVQGNNPQEFVNNIVRNLPGLSTDYRLIASLRDNLALLAEAAPLPFLEALERLLEGDTAKISPIFEEQESFLMAHQNHTGLLWALETLAWDPDYLLRTATCLAKLAAIDPGGSVSNRPINSLREIFLPWSPSTRATTAQRIGILKHILETTPGVAWELLVKLLPRHHDNSNPTSKPRFREFEGLSNEVLTYGLVWESQTAIVALALERVGAHPERWEALVEVMGQFPQPALDQTLHAIEVFFEEQPADIKFRIWNALHKEVNRHKVFADTDWAFEKSVLARLEALVAKYQPVDPILASAWLFNDWMPDIPQSINLTGDPMDAVEQKRVQALREIYENLGTSGIVALAKSVKLPGHIAAVVNKLELDFDKLLVLLNSAIDNRDKLESLAVILVAEGVSRFGDKWVAEIHTLVASMGLEPTGAAKLFLAIPDTPTSWKIVEGFGVAINEAYWSVKNAYLIEGTSEDLLVAAENYVARGRPLAAITALHRRMPEIPSKFLMYLLEQAISQINTPDEGIDTMTTYYIELVFDELEKREDVAPAEVARLEFAYLPLFSRRKKPLTLHHLMVSDPEMYVFAICAIFKPASVEVPKPSAQEQRVATSAYELLSSLKVLPGQQGGDVDFEALNNWCMQVRKLGAERDRKDVTDIYIGHLLAHAPASQLDGAWPHESVRKIIEQLASNEIERGIVIERFNMRGVYRKGIGEGGQQERELADTARAWAAAMPGYPRTVAMLIRIAESWLRDAENADVRAEKDALRE